MSGSPFFAGLLFTAESYLASSKKGAFILSFCKKPKGSEKMKKTFTSFVCLLLSILLIASLSACATETPNTDETTSQTETSTVNQLPELWENAVYTEDKLFGDGSKTLTVEVTAGEKTVTFTVKTDKKTVGEALIEHNLIAGDNGDYGLYIKTVNGILADYSVDQSYWAFYIGEEYASTGVDSTDITDGANYKLVYTK